MGYSNSYRVLYSAFYEQNAGLNFLIFTVLLSILQIWIRPDLIKNRRWILFVVMSVFSAIQILIYSSSLSILANLMAVVIQSSALFYTKASLPVGLLNGLYSLGSSIVFVAFDTKTLFLISIN